MKSPKKDYSINKKSIITNFLSFLLIFLLLSLFSHTISFYFKFASIIFSSFYLINISSNKDKTLLKILIYSINIFLAWSILSFHHIALKSDYQYLALFLKADLLKNLIDTIRIILFPIFIYLFDQKKLLQNQFSVIKKKLLKFQKYQHLINIFLAYLIVVIPSFLLKLFLSQIIMFFMAKQYHESETSKNKKTILVFFYSYAFFLLLFLFNGPIDFFIFFKSRWLYNLLKLIMEFTPIITYLYLSKNQRLNLLTQKYQKIIAKINPIKLAIYTLFFSLILIYLFPQNYKIMVNKFQKNHDLNSRLAINPEQTVETYAQALEQSNYPRAYLTFHNKFNQKTIIEEIGNSHQLQNQETNQSNKPSLTDYLEYQQDLDQTIGRVNRYSIKNKNCQIAAIDIFGSYANDEQRIDFHPDSEFFTLTLWRNQFADDYQVVVLKENDQYLITHINECQD